MFLTMLHPQCHTQSTTFLFQQAIHFDSAYAPLPTKEEERKTLQQQLREEERDEQDAAKPHEKSSTTVLHTGFLEFMKTVCGEHNPKQTKQDCTPTSVDTESEPIDPVKVLEGIMNGQSTEDMEVSGKIHVYCTCWWYSLCNFQYRSLYENTCSYNFEC